MANCKCNNFNEFKIIVKKISCSNEIWYLLKMIESKNLKECEYKNKDEELYFIKNSIRYSNNLIMITLEKVK